MTMEFSVNVTTNPGQYCWWLYAANGEQVAWAGETFPSFSNAQRAAEAFQSGAAAARFETYPDTAGKYRWRAWRSSDKVAASGEAFASKANAERAALNVKADVPFATFR